MKRFILTGLLLLSMSTHAFALLSPLSQSIVEFKEILNSPELTQKLGSSEIITVIKKADNGYLIKTNKSILLVDIDYLPSTGPGPQKFTLKFQEQ